MSVRYADVVGRPSLNPQPDGWWTVNCRCRGDGPWTIWGPTNETFLCARCGEQMTVRSA